MRIFLTGATGFIGGRLLRDLAFLGHELTCLVRPGKHSAVEALALPRVNTLLGTFNHPAEWTQQVADHDIVINAVGIIRESADSRFQNIHTDTPIALFNQAKQSGVRKIIQVSAMGADENTISKYHLTKRAADEHLKKLGVPYVIFRLWSPGSFDDVFSFTRGAADRTDSE